MGRIRSVKVVELVFTAGWTSSFTLQYTADCTVCLVNPPPATPTLLLQEQKQG